MSNKPTLQKKLEEHILEEFTTDNGWESEDAVANLRAQLKAFNHLPTIRQGAVEMIRGGYFLCYYKDVNDFLEELGVLDKRCSNERNWDKYIILLSDTIVRLAK